MAKLTRRDISLEMTPMIDVVFQLIIFFIVTVKVQEQINRDITLPDGPHGEIVKPRQSALTIEVDRRGRTTIQNVPVSDDLLRSVIAQRRCQFGNAFSLMIRGDHRSHHAHIERVMNICTEEGISHISFLATRESTRR